MKDYLVIFKKLELAYGEKFTNEKMEFYIQHLKNININDLKIIVEKIILNEKFMPTIAVINNYAKDDEQSSFIRKLEVMKNNGYFKTAFEYEKILMWFEKGIIPNWLKGDMEKYKQNKISYEQNLLEGN